MMKKSMLMLVTFVVFLGFTGSAFAELSHGTVTEAPVAGQRVTIRVLNYDDTPADSSHNVFVYSVGASTVDMIRLVSKKQTNSAGIVTFNAPDSASFLTAGKYFVTASDIFADNILARKRACFTNAVSELIVYGDRSSNLTLKLVASVR